MRSYLGQSLGDVLLAFSSNEPVPGGGSAAALSGALGVSLLLMVAGLERTRTGSAAERTALDEAAERLRPLRVALGSLIDRDSEAYSAVMEAFRLPKVTADQITVRRRAIGEAMRTATDTPLQTMRACRQALADAWIVASQGAKSASSDVGVAIELLRAAIRGAGLNVDVNAGELADKDWSAHVRAERQELETASAADAERARAAF
jgi:formiminotetrahydrofolate cyclodeaminase